jgi:hypothetical protein
MRHTEHIMFRVTRKTKNDYETFINTHNQNVGPDRQITLADFVREACHVHWIMHKEDYRSLASHKKI